MRWLKILKKTSTQCFTNLLCLRPGPPLSGLCIQDAVPAASCKQDKNKGIVRGGQMVWPTGATLLEQSGRSMGPAISHLWGGLNPNSHLRPHQRAKRKHVIIPSGPPPRSCPVKLNSWDSLNFLRSTDEDYYLPCWLSCRSDLIALINKYICRIFFSHEGKNVTQLHWADFIWSSETSRTSWISGFATSAQVQTWGWFGCACKVKANLISSLHGKTPKQIIIIIIIMTQALITYCPGVKGMCVTP